MFVCGLKSELTIAVPSRDLATSALLYMDTYQGLLSVAWPTGVQIVFFFCSRYSVMLFGAQGSPSPGLLLISGSLLFILEVIMIYLFVIDYSFTR